MREIGCSNFSAEQLDEAEAISRDKGIARYVSVQNEYSLLRRGPERFGVLDACARNNVAFLPYFPLASGMLTGKYKRNEEPPTGTRLAAMPAERRDQAFSDKNFDRVEGLDAWARDQGHSLLELAFSWLLAHPAVASVIAGATKPEQIAANVAAAGWSLSDADLRDDRRDPRLGEINRRGPSGPLSGKSFARVMRIRHRSPRLVVTEGGEEFVTVTVIASRASNLPQAD